MSNIPKIFDIELTDVLAKLGYGSNAYHISGNNITMKDKGKLTGGWNGQLVGADGKGFLKCNSGKKPGRFEGDNLTMVQECLSLSQGEAVAWFEENFPDRLQKEKKQKQKSVKDEWDKFPQVTQEQINFLHKRKIKYELVKDYVRNFDGTIGLPIYTANDTMVSYQGRNHNSTTKKDRYRLRAGPGAKGLFADFSKIDNTKEVFLVEGMTDWLSLKQHTDQVIALVSKDNGISEIKALKNKYKFIFIPDNDEAGKQSLEKLEEFMNMGVFSLSSYSDEDDEIGDVNDLWNMCLENNIDGEGLIEILSTECTRPKTNIDLALQKAIDNRDVGSWEVGDKVFDEATGGITPGSVMIINGLSGEGKTTTLDWIITSLMRHEKKMGFCSIDDDIGKMLAMFLGRYFHKDWMQDIYPDIENYVKKYGRDKFDNFLLYDDVNTLGDFERVIKDEKLDVLIIDYIQVIEGLPGKDMKDKMLNASRTLQRMAIDTRTAIICLCQVSKGEDQKPVLYRTPMESQYIKSTADTFINVGIFNGKHKIAFVKNKYGATKYKNSEFDTSRDEKTGKIYIFEDEGGGNGGL